MPYYTTAGPEKGPILWKQLSHAISVVDEVGYHMPTGMALPLGWDDQGRTVWKLVMRSTGEVAGKWIAIDREFKPAE
jgi:hypothetical protein